MTRPSRSALVLDGETVKFRLQAERVEARSPVHVDWVRFTTYLRNTPSPTVDQLFPSPTSSVWDADYRKMLLNRTLATIQDCETGPAQQAWNLAQKVAEALGADFSVNPEVKKGHDFYKFRWPIEREGAEMGWVGFLTSGDSPRQASQARTIHVNLFGAATTFAETGWNSRIADLIDDHSGDLTRCDLALDYFDGLAGGIDGVLADYKAGLCDSGGRRLKVNMVGDWANGNSRSIYFGSKEAGKQTNVYEKGHQLFGPEAGSDWLRVELRYGNKLRELPSDMLRRPADFFAGASEWHASMLLKADAICEPEKVKTTGRLAAETVEAEATRNLRWAFNVAAPTIATAFQHLGDDFLSLCVNQKLPGRLQKFKPAEIRQAFEKAINRFTPPQGHGPALSMA